MKKLALILAFLLVPCMAFGMEMLTDGDMDQVTGQSGVTIAFDDVQLFVNIDRMAYIDCDGFNTLVGYNCSSALGGALFIENFQLDTVVLNAILSTNVVDGLNANPTIQSGTNTPLYSATCGDIPLQYNYAQTTAFVDCYLGSAADPTAFDASSMTLGLDNIIYTNSATGATNNFQAQAINIDVVDALPILTQGWQGNYAGNFLSPDTVGGILISLPTMEIHVGSFSFTPKYTGYVGTQNSGAANDVANARALGIDSNFGTIQIDGIDMALLSGWLEIAPH